MRYWAMVAADLDDDPKIQLAGFWGSTIYQHLLRRNAQRPTWRRDGRIPGTLAAPIAIAKKLQCTADQARTGLQCAVTAGLISIGSTGEVYLLAWPKWQSLRTATTLASDQQESKNFSPTADKAKARAKATARELSPAPLSAAVVSTSEAVVPAADEVRRLLLREANRCDLPEYLRNLALKAADPGWCADSSPQEFTRLDKKTGGAREP